MRIEFNLKAGEISDFFQFLYLTHNSDWYRKQLGEYGIEPNEEYEKFIIGLGHNVKLDEEKLKLYYGKDFGLADVFISNSEIWKLLELDKCLSFVKEMDGNTLKFRLIKELIRKKGYSGDLEKVHEEAEVIVTDKQKSLELIKGLEFNSSLKWELFCFLEEPEKYRDEYINIMEKMVPIFYKHYKSKKKVMEEFSKSIESKLKGNKDDFFKNTMANVIRQDMYEEIFITTSYINYYSLRFDISGSSNYVFLGLGFEETIKQYKGEEENKLNKYINIYKNFSDATRFQILRLLVEDKEYFNKDIAEKLGITGATVSYHMDSLLTAELVTLDRRDRKNYYTVNKDVIREGIEFLKREFNL